MINPLKSPASWLISFIAIVFAYWFAVHQVQAVAVDGMASYPCSFFLLTIFKCYLTIIAFYGFVRAILKHVSADKLSSLAIAMTFMPLTFVSQSIPMYWIAGLVFVSQLVILLMVLQKQDYHRLASQYLMDVCVLTLFFTLHYFLTTRYSPSHWGTALLNADGFNTDEAMVLAPIFKGFLLAKQFSFSSMDYSNWAGMLHTPFLLNSPFMQVLAFGLDLPSASYESFHIVLMSLYFILIVAGSFGFYLFLKYAAGVQVILALWGGLLFGFSGAPMINQIMANDNGAFISSYELFPYALLLISLAFTKANKMYALWASVALAAQLFIFAPHPEGLLYSSAFYFLYVGGLVLFSPWNSRKANMHLAAYSLVSYLALTAFDVVPILYDRITGSLYLVAHMGDMHTVSLAEIKSYMKLVMIALPISMLLQLARQKLTPVYLSSMFLAAAILIFMLVGSHERFMHLAATVLHFGIHFSNYWRFGIYFCLCSYTVFIFAVDAAAWLIYEWIVVRPLNLFRRVN